MDRRRGVTSIVFITGLAAYSGVLLGRMKLKVADAVSFADLGNAGISRIYATNSCRWR